MTIPALSVIVEGLASILGPAVMMAIGGLLIYFAIAKEYEPVLLLPIGFG